ncbi:MAG: glycosyltransferase family 2 protein [Cyclobacteriaceae bacterium]
MPYKVSIVLVNFKNWEDTLECLSSIARLVYLDYQIIIVDNSPDNDSFLEISKFLLEHTSKSFRTFSYEDFQSSLLEEKYVLVKAKNRGFAHANNVAIKRIIETNSSDFCWLLNNDVVLDEMCLTHLVNAVDEKHWIVGSLLLYYDRPKIIQAAGGRYNHYFGFSWHYMEGRPKDDIILPKFLNSKTVDYPVGASMFIDNRAFEEAGLLEESYFLYYEEIDFIRRLQEIGKTHLIATESMVYHKEGRSIGSGRATTRSRLSDLLTVYNRIQFTWKYHRRCIITVYFGVFLVLLNRVRRFQWVRSKEILKILLGRITRDEITNVSS